VLGEPPAWYHGVGAVLILPSVYLATAQRRVDANGRA
jgi:drug/metabolite transporter (DMT)-like permease